jgi:hypothetical protein
MKISELRQLIKETIEEAFFIGEDDIDNVECKKCGWKWKLSNGGENPYLCHKCDYDNSYSYNDSIDEYDVENEQDLKELRQGLLDYLRQQLPNFPDYVIKDWIYKMIKKDDNINTAEGIQDWIDSQLKDLKWETKTNFLITMDIFGDKTQQELKSRIGGEIRQDVGKDIERHKTQQKLLKSQGISKEPIILFKTKVFSETRFSSINFLKSYSIILNELSCNVSLIKLPLCFSIILILSINIIILFNNTNLPLSLTSLIYSKYFLISSSSDR